MIAILGALSEFKVVTINSTLIFLMVASAVFLGARPLMWQLRQKEREYDDTLNRVLLLGIPPKVIFVLTAVSVLLFGFIGFAIFRGGARGMMAMFVLGAFGFMFPTFLIRRLKRKRQKKLEDQLVGGIQSLASGVRAGLNLVQGMQMVSRDAPAPLRQEFAHMVREYEYGLSLDVAMEKASVRIGLPNYRLLFSALLTHRERGGNLGETLDDIAASIREIQRLEGRVQTLTAQGRATARWLGVLPVAILIFLYIFLREDTLSLFREPVGNVILATAFVLNIISFLWIRKIMDIDL